MTVLVTGGSGYIGSHVVALLRERGESVVVVDDLLNGRLERIPDVPIEVFDVSTEAATAALVEVMRVHRVSAVIHFAARKQVAESIARPTWYLSQNVGGVANVVDAMALSGVRDIVFSSSAAVYGDVTKDLVAESEPTVPMNPYGQSKLAGEWLIGDAAAAFGMRGTSLRYFNVAGAGDLALADRGATNLVPMVFERIDAGEAPLIFGDDYPTPDGTCIRDFIHVQDLADAHLAVLDAMRSNVVTNHEIFNVGTGTGFSVREVIDVMRDVAKGTMAPELRERRAGDPACVVADASRIERVIGWRASRGLGEIIESAWDGWRHTR
jgi:UDP-glucose 4-epimerase